MANDLYGKLNTFTSLPLYSFNTTKHVFTMIIPVL